MKYFKFDIYGTHVQVKNVIDQIILPDESFFINLEGKNVIASFRNAFICPTQ